MKFFVIQRTDTNQYLRDDNGTEWVEDLRWSSLHPSLEEAERKVSHLSVPTVILTTNFS